MATPTEASALGAIGALLIAALNKKIDINFIKETSQRTAIVSTMIFAILIGASIFSLIFRGVGGDGLIDLIFGSLPGGPYIALLFVLFLVFTWLYFRLYRNMLRDCSSCSTAITHDGI